MCYQNSLFYKIDFMIRGCSFIGVRSALDLTKMGKQYLVFDWSKVPGAFLIRKNFI